MLAKILTCFYYLNFMLFRATATAASASALLRRGGGGNKEHLWFASLCPLIIAGQLPGDAQVAHRDGRQRQGEGEGKIK